MWMAIVMNVNVAMNSFQIVNEKRIFPTRPFSFSCNGRYFSSRRITRSDRCMRTRKPEIALRRELCALTTNSSGHVELKLECSFIDFPFSDPILLINRKIERRKTSLPLFPLRSLSARYAILDWEKGHDAIKAIEGRAHYHSFHSRLFIQNDYWSVPAFWLAGKKSFIYPYRILNSFLPC